MTAPLTVARHALDALDTLLKKSFQHLARESSDGGKLSISKMDIHQLALYNLSYAAVS